ncbi:AraC family transcriptional regulator [Haloferula sp.]|uniref:AraC family transcriptional regulator n=1 Tax=Haloferula sp. TaxID=2497595 RepID=UPI003C72FC3E
MALVCAGREVCKPDYLIERASFEYHVIEFVVSGTWTLECRGGTRELKAGALFTYGPKVEYTMAAGKRGEWIKYFAAFTGSSAARLLAESGLTMGEVRYAQPRRWIHQLFDQLVDSANMPPDDACEIANRITELILLRTHLDGRESEDASGASEKTYVRCRAFIRDHYLTVGSVAEIAAGCNLDPAYLARLFKRHSKERPLQLLNRLKTQHAADLIMRRGFGVALAGQAVGFGDPYHFSRVFKRVHGISPGNLRSSSS